jgi:hypothetical protein
MNINVSGADFEIEYDEPNVNADGSPLQDLGKTTVYYDAGDGRVLAKELEATSPTGNGHIVTRINVSLPKGTEKNVSVWATAWDKSGNESSSSIPVTVRVDSLAPAAPR